MYHQISKYILTSRNKTVRKSISCHYCDDTEPRLDQVVELLHDLTRSVYHSARLSLRQSAGPWDLARAAITLTRSQQSLHSRLERSCFNGCCIPHPQLLHINFSELFSQLHVILYKHVRTEIQIFCQFSTL